MCLRVYSCSSVHCKLATKKTNSICMCVCAGALACDFYEDLQWCASPLHNPLTAHTSRRVPPAAKCPPCDDWLSFTSRAQSKTLSLCPPSLARIQMPWLRKVCNLSPNYFLGLPQSNFSLPAIGNHTRASRAIVDALVTACPNVFCSTSWKI